MRAQNFAWRACLPPAGGGGTQCQRGWPTDQPACTQFVQSAADTKSEGVRQSGTGRAAQKGERTINLTAQSNDNNYAVLPIIITRLVLCGQDKRICAIYTFYEKIFQTICETCLNNRGLVCFNFTYLWKRVEIRLEMVYNINCIIMLCLNEMKGVWNYDITNQ